MKYKPLFTLFFVIILEFFIIGCAGKNTPGSIAEDAYAFGVYSTVAIPAIITAPLWYPAIYDPYKNKTREQVIDMVGKPIARYKCKVYEIWEYTKDKIYGSKRFIKFSTKTSHGQRKYIPFLDECRLLEGTPSKKTKNEWIDKVYECGKNYYDQVSKGSKASEFFIDMKTNHGKFTITQWRRDRILNAEYVIFYDGKEIYKSPKANFDSSKPPGEKITETVKFGPGKSSSIKIRVLRTFEYMYELKISCPK